jgi:RNA polymerase sigma-70 factor, ECF subfamily
MDADNEIIKIWQENNVKIKQFICYKVNDDDCCNDILHDLFLKITDNSEKIALIEKPASYIIKMAQNAVIDFYKTQKKKGVQNCDCSQLEERQGFSDQELYNISLMPFIQALPPIYKEALFLSDIEGLSQKETAERLKISYTGAKSRVQRARKMLKESILNCCNYKFDKFGNIVSCCE